MTTAASGQHEGYVPGSYFRDSLSVILKVLFSSHQEVGCPGCSHSARDLLSQGQGLRSVNIWSSPVCSRGTALASVSQADTGWLQPTREESNPDKAPSTLLSAACSHPEGTVEWGESNSKISYYCWARRPGPPSFAPLSR